MVPAQARRNHQDGGEPAQALRGYRQLRLDGSGARRALGRAAIRLRALDCARRADLSRRQPAHEARSLLGMGHRRGARPASRRDLPRGSVHPPQGDEGARQIGIQPVVHVLHLAKLQARDRGLPDRAHPGSSGRLHDRQSLAQHPGHPSRALAAGRPARVPHPLRPRRHAQLVLGHLQRLRALREPRAARPGRVRGFGEVPARPVGPRPAAFGSTEPTTSA
jgi:hypothetical protein